jgi:uncharacterized membrane protein
MTPSSRARAYRKHDPRSAVGRVLLGSAAGLVAAVLAPAGLGLSMRITLGWNVSALSLLVMIWLFVMNSDPAATRCRAASADPGRTAVWIVVSAASAFSLFSAAVLLRHSRQMAAESGALTTAAALVAVISAWGLTHTEFTLRYAHLYYRDDAEGEGGLNFPGGQAPDDYDFAYLAFTVGMCFQVSDVTVSSAQFRRAVLSHALLSFAYNTVILALALNLLFSQVG